MDLGQQFDLDPDNNSATNEYCLDEMNYLARWLLIVQLPLLFTN